MDLLVRSTKAPPPLAVAALMFKKGHRKRSQTGMGKVGAKYHHRLVIKSPVVFLDQKYHHIVGGDQKPQSIFGLKYHPRVSKVLMVAKSLEVLLSHIQKKVSGGGIV